MKRIDHQFYNGKEFKRCCKCKAYLELRFFSTAKREWDGFDRSCKFCTATRGFLWTLEHHEKHLHRVRSWRAKNIDRARELCKKGQKRRRERSPEKVKNYEKQFRERPDRKMHAFVSRGVKYTLWRAKNKLCLLPNASWTSLVGFTVDELVDHIRKQFGNGFSFENYGDVWEVDHVKPIASFNIKSINEDEFKKCWSLENLRPLSVVENRKKGKRLTI